MKKSTLVERILSRATGPTNGEGVHDGDASPPGSSESAGLALAPTEPRPRGRRAPAAPRTKTDDPVADYRYPDATRTNNPPTGQASWSSTSRRPRSRSTTPTTRTSTRSSRGLGSRSGPPSRSTQSPCISTSGVSTQAILRAVKREDTQRSLFADNDLPGGKGNRVLQPRRRGGRNRLVLGDSLLVMNSLLEREQLAGKVQCIYMDPPYGVKFNSNFQPSISRRDVKDGDDASLTREPWSRSRPTATPGSRHPQLPHVHA